MSASPGPAAGDMHVLLENVHMSFGEREVFRGLTCGFPRGRISVILGGSGVGKSTTLRLIGALIRPQSGRVIVDGQDATKLSDRGLYLMRRKLGMMFQGGALLDSESVFDNIALPLREQGWDRVIIEREVHAALTAVGVSDADRLLPGELSGGMLRRVALARAIIRKPTILMCDEPLSGLDPVSLRRIEKLLVKLNREHKITVLVVSHDVPSTMRMADHVVLLTGERAVEGTPTELSNSSDRVVADFFHEGLNVTPGGRDD